MFFLIHRFSLFFIYFMYNINHTSMGRTKAYGLFIDVGHAQPNENYRFIRFSIPSIGYSIIIKIGLSVMQPMSRRFDARVRAEWFLKNPSRRLEIFVYETTRITRRLRAKESVRRCVYNLPLPARNSCRDNGPTGVNLDRASVLADGRCALAESRRPP